MGGGFKNDGTTETQPRRLARQKEKTHNEHRTIKDMTQCPRRGRAGPEWAGPEWALQVRGLRIPLRWRRNSASSLFSTSDWLQIGHWVVQQRSANQGPEGGAGWKARRRSLGGPLSPPPGSGGQVVVFLKGQYALKSASHSFK